MRHRCAGQALTNSVLRINSNLNVVLLHAGQATQQIATPDGKAATPRPGRPAGVGGLSTEPASVPEGADWSYQTLGAKKRKETDEPNESEDDTQREEQANKRGGRGISSRAP